MIVFDPLHCSLQGSTGHDGAPGRDGAPGPKVTLIHVSEYLLLFSVRILSCVVYEVDLELKLFKLTSVKFSSYRETVVRVALLDLLDPLVLLEPLELLAPLERLVTAERP